MRVLIPAGSYRLPGFLDFPLCGDHKLGFVLCHGAGPLGKNQPLIKHLHSFFSKTYSVLSLDFPGYGESQTWVVKKPEDHNLSPYVKAATSYLRAMRGVKSVVVGHSMGGKYALLNTPNDLNTIGLVVIAGLYPPASKVQFLRLALTVESRSAVKRETEVSQADLVKYFLDNDAFPERYLSKVSPKPLLVIHARRDEYRTIRLYEKILFKAAKDPKLLVELDADHRFSGKYAEVTEAISSWFIENAVRLIQLSLSAP